MLAKPEALLAPLGPPIEHEPRFYTSFPGASYVLPADEPERERLFLQQSIIRRIFDGKLILPPIEFQAGDSILESATGTGAWLFEVYESLPPILSQSMTFQGIDIEPRILPTPAVLAQRSIDPNIPNISFSTSSILALPPDWTAKFTFLNQRLVLAALRTVEWPVALREMYRVLVPGGYLQLCETYGWRAGPAQARHAEISRALFAARGMDVDIALRLPGLVADAGFVDVHVDEREVRLGRDGGEVGRDQAVNQVKVWRGMKGPVLNAGGFGLVSSEEELEEMYEEILKEYDEVPGASVGWTVVWARKPVE